MFGSNLGGSPGVTVKLNNITAPIFAASATQINFQVPWELAGQAQASLTVTTGGLTSTPVTVSLAPQAPGIFSTNASGNWPGSYSDREHGVHRAAGRSIPGSHNVVRGDFISIFCTDLGAVTNQPPTGVVASGSPSATFVTSLVEIGGDTVPAASSSLAPGFVGLYQVNVQVPTTTVPGNEAPVSLLMGDTASDTVTIAVQ